MMIVHLTGSGPGVSSRLQLPHLAYSRQCMYRTCPCTARRRCETYRHTGALRSDQTSSFNIFYKPQTVNEIIIIIIILPYSSTLSFPTLLRLTRETRYIVFYIVCIHSPHRESYTARCHPAAPTTSTPRWPPTSQPSYTQTPSLKTRAKHTIHSI